MNALIEALNAWGTRFTGFALPMLAQSALLMALLFALDAALRRRVRATVRYALWMLLLVKLLLPPTLGLPTSLAYWLPQPTAMAAQPVNLRLASTPVRRGDLGTVKPAIKVPESVASADVSEPSLGWPAKLLIIWLAAFIGLAAGVASRIRSIVRQLRETREAPAEVRELLDSCRTQLGIKRAVRLRLTSTLGSPAICGFFQPVILIPEALPGRLSQAELRAVLLHELGHFRRGDLWVGHAQILLQLFYWYNPLLWLANRAIQRVREQAVDEMVLVEMREQADAYPETLLQIAKLTLTRPALSLGLVGILEPVGGLKERIQHILRRPFPTTARVGIRGLLLVTVMALVALPMACKNNAPVADNTPKPPMKMQTLTAEQAQELEAKVAKGPEDLEARTQLLGHYFLAQQIPGDNRKKRQGHILWLIEHHPELNIQPPIIELNAFQDGSSYETGKTLWLKQAQKNPKNVVILEQAAHYLIQTDRKTSEDFLKRAQALQPGNPRWSEQLAHLYALNTFAPGGDPDSANKALSEMEKVHAANPTADFEHLDDLAKMAFNAGDLTKAKSYATDLLQQAPGHLKAWNYGNAIHTGNMILGRIAVRGGKIEDAKKYLLEAGETPGSPQLNSFGPNMSLAKDLFEKGEKDTVVTYFQECGNFWKMGADRLKLWTKDVNADIAPDFAGNLVF